MEQFRYGLRNDVKDLLLPFPEEPKSRTEAINQVEQTFRMTLRMSLINAKKKVQEQASLANTPTPMEIDTTRQRRPLS